MLPGLLFILFLLLSVTVAWLGYSQRKTRFVDGFGRLLDAPRPVDGVSDWIRGRAAVGGEFRGRHVTIVLRDRQEEPSTLVITMATLAAPTPDTYDFAGFRADRDGEAAAFALEVKHGLRLRHAEGYLQASRDSLPRSFDESTWQSVLETMATLCGSIERR